MNSERQPEERSEYVNGRTAADMQNERASEPTRRAPRAQEGSTDREPDTVSQRIRGLLRRLTGRDRISHHGPTVPVLIGVLLLALTGCDTAAEEAAESDSPAAAEEAGNTEPDDASDLSQLEGTYAATVSDVEVALGPDDTEVRLEDGQLVIEGGSTYPVRDETEVTCDDTGCSWDAVVGPALPISIPADADGPPFQIVNAEDGDIPHTGGVCGEGSPDAGRTPRVEGAWMTVADVFERFSYQGTIGGGSNSCISFTVELTPSQ